MSLINTLLRLMECRGSMATKGPEDLLSIEVANFLRAATLEGRLLATWTHIPNEVAGVRTGDKVALRRATRAYSKAKSMGMITGVPDFVFVWADGGGWIELKAESGRLSPSQKDYKEWATATCSRYAVCRTLDDVVEKLLEWGVLRA